MGGWRQPVEGERAQSGRALRNRRYRRIFQDNHQTKRLFTPEIKRFLKGWLVRRRKNPYPNRTEKKELAFKTGLTYIQICNWFANWRRKLKNSSHNTEDSWGHLIKDYNNKAKGNVEQFSISSDDSIWDEAAYSMKQNSTTVHDHMTETDHCYYTQNNNNNNAQYSDNEEEDSTGGRVSQWNSNSGDEGVKYSHFLEKRIKSEDSEEEKPVLLSKWLESAARYRPREASRWGGYNLTWEPGRRRRHREELDAAEALAFLSSQIHQPFPITGH